MFDIIRNRTHYYRRGFVGYIHRNIQIEVKMNIDGSKKVKIVAKWDKNYMR
jgi:hypothetical protein